MGESGYIICSFDSDSENYFSLIQKIQEKLSEDEALLKSRLASLNQLEAINKVLVVLDELRSLKRSTMYYNMKIIDEDPTTKMLVLGFNEMNQGVRQCLNNLNLCNADDVDAISNLVKKLRESIYYGKDEIWVNRNLIGLRIRFLETISPRGFFLSP